MKTPGASGGKKAKKYRRRRGKVKGAQKALDAVVKNLSNARKKLDKAKADAAKAETDADAAAQNPKEAVGIQKDIIQYWHGVGDSRTPAGPHPSGVTAAYHRSIHEWISSDYT